MVVPNRAPNRLHPNRMPAPCMGLAHLWGSMFPPLLFTITSVWVPLISIRIATKLLLHMMVVPTICLNYTQPTIDCNSLNFGYLKGFCLLVCFYLWSIEKLLSWMDWEGGRWVGKTRSGLGVWAEFGDAWCSGDTGVLDGVGGLEGLIPTCGFWS